MRLDGPQLAMELRRLLDRAFTTPGPGAAIGIYRAGQLVTESAVGLARLDGPAIDRHTPFEIASVSKQMGACAALSLARDGVIDLDADVRRYVPELAAAGISVRHCLQHTSGLPDYLLLAEIAGTPPTNVCGYEAFLTGLAELELGFVPGSDIAYSNTGYVVAAIACERASGLSWAQFLEQRVFAPLGMASSTVGVVVGDGRTEAAVSYRVDGERFVAEGLAEDVLPRGARHTVGDGQVVTTLTDLAAWHGFLHDGRVLGADLRELMLTRTTLTGGRVTSYGLGIRHEQVGGIAGFGHSGSMWGFRAHSLAVPAREVSVAVLANRSDADPEDLAWRAVRVAGGDGPSGYWYSAKALRATWCEPRADGGVELDDGVETRAFSPAGDQWVGHDEVTHLHLDGGELVHTDEMGRAVRFRKVAAATAPDVGGLAGAFAMRWPRERLVLRAVGPGLQLCREGQPALPLHHLTTQGTSEVFTFPGGVAIVDPGPPTRLTIGTEGAVLRDLPRLDPGGSSEQATMA
jgi:CubicO group peptidase (beta-lactamase class C family)